MSNLLRIGLLLGGALAAYKMVGSGALSRNKKARWDLRETIFIGRDIGIDWDEVDFFPRDLARGIMVELEHGTVDFRTDVTHDNIDQTAKIAWAHLNEFPDYYQRLDAMEQEAKEYWESE